jgi:hypothetical protein
VKRNAIVGFNIQDGMEFTVQFEYDQSEQILYAIEG